MEQSHKVRSFFIIFALLLIVFIGLIPTILSTSFGTKILVKAAQKKIHGNVSVKQLSIHWFGPQIIKQFQYTTDQTTIGASTITVDSSLFSLLLGKLKVGKPSIPTVYYSGTLLVENGQIQYTQDKILSEIREVDLRLVLVRQGPSSITMQGLTSHQGQNGSFHITGHYQDYKFQLNGDLKQIPMPILDHFLSPQLEGIVLEMVGNTLSGSIAIQGDRDTAHATISLNAPHMQANVQAQYAEKNLSWNISSKILDGNLVSNGSSSQFLTKNRLDWKNAKVNATLQTENFPIYVFSDFFGKGLSSHIELEKQPKKSAELTVNASNPRLSIENAIFAIDEKIQLKSQAHFTFQPSFTQNQDIILTQAAPITGEIQSLAFTSLKDLQIQAKIQSKLLEFSKFYSLENIQFKEIEITLHGHLDSTVQTIMVFNDQHSVPFQFLGKDQEISLSATNFFKNFYFKWKGPQITMSGSLKKKGQRLLTTQKPIQIEYTLTPQIYKHFDLPSKLAHPSVFSCQIDEFAASLDDLSLSAVKLQAKAKATSLPITLLQYNQTFTLRPLELAVQLTPGKDPQISFDGKVFEDKTNPGIVQGKLEIPLNYFTTLGKELSVMGYLEIKDFSTPFASSFFKDLPPLSPLIGNRFSLNLKKEKPEQFTIELNSPNLSFKGDFSLTDKALSFNRLAQFKWILTKEAFESLDHFITKEKSSPFSIETPSHISGKINKLVIPLSDANFMTNTILEMKFHIDQFSLMEKATKEVTLLSPLDITLSKKSVADSLAFTLNGKVLKEKTQTGSLSFHGNMDRDHIQLDGEIHRFPTIFLDTVARLWGYQKQPFFAIFGPNFDAKFTLDTSGPLQVHIQSPRASMELDGNLNQGTLLLNRPFQASIQMTEELSDIFLKQFDIYAISSSEPIRLFIPAKDFVFPFQNYDPTKVRIPSLSLKLGQIVCERKGSVRSLAKIFDIKKSKVNLWFTDMDMRIKHGRLHIDRTEVLVQNKYQIAFWGKVDLAKEYVNMILGLTANALQEAFGLKVPSNYVLTIPIEGPFGNVRINTAEATKKIALLVAKQKGIAPSKGIWGEVFGVIEGFTDDQSKVPPPKKPFPWENTQTKQQDSPKAEKPKVKKKKSKTVLDKLKKL